MTTSRPCWLMGWLPSVSLSVAGGEPALPMLLGVDWPISQDRDGRDRQNVASPMRVLRIPFSTNVERVSLALAHKGVAVEWVDVDPRDRTPVREVSGQDLVPVLQTDQNEVIADSM